MNDKLPPEGYEIVYSSGRDVPIKSHVSGPEITATIDWPKFGLHEEKDTGVLVNEKEEMIFP
jgi:hypothetical protein